jgi:hypothetical protein
MSSKENVTNSSQKPIPDTDAQMLGQRRHTTSIQESRAAVDQVIGSARKIIRIFDRDLSDPGYSDPARIRLLESFIQSSRRNQVQVVLHDPHNLNRDCARLMALFRRHADVFAIHRTLDAATHAMDALVIADEHSYWNRLHQDQPQIVFAVGDAINAIPLVHRFNEIWESSEPAASATTLGL